MVEADVNNMVWWQKRIDSKVNAIPVVGLPVSCLEQLPSALLFSLKSFVLRLSLFWLGGVGEDRLPLLGSLQYGHSPWTRTVL